MSYDFYAEFWDVNRRGEKNFGKIDRDYKKSDSTYSKIKLTALHLNTPKNKNWAKEKKYKPWIKSDYIRNVIVPENERMEKLNIKKPDINISALPKYSAFLKIDFGLKKPYISRDEEEFYIIENPICKEKVFKVPYVRPSSWKGNLRWVAMRNFIDEFDSMSDEEKIKRRISLIRIFGNEKDKIESFLDGKFKDGLKNKYKIALMKYYDKKENGELNVRGRLQFYPTFFNKIGLDVINPHDRKTKTGKTPILYEVVPEDASGTFSILYVPFDLIGNEEKLKKQVPEDLKVISEAVEKMLTVYGFSAKKTSGYGIAKLESKYFDTKCSESKKKEFEEIISNTIQI